MKVFSRRLNKWIKKRINNIPYKVIESQETFDYLKYYYTQHYEILVSSENCDNNIFGSKQNNINFRVWHDLVHLQNNLEFSFEDECEVAFLQCSELPENWYYEKMLIMSEVIGQCLYHKKYGKFIYNQIDFTKELLKNGKI